MSVRSPGWLSRAARRKRYWLLVGLVGLTIPWFLVRPSNDRDWVENERILPFAEFQKHLVHVHNIRNTSYVTTENYTPSYYDRTFDLNKLTSVWFVVEPFSEWGGAAHTFVSFGFEGPEYVAISVELRKEKGESFSPLRGLFKQYELIYVVADERDVIKLRTNYRHDDVFLYPIRASQDKIRELFVSMLERANRLREHPEFYNTLKNTCTTNIVRHINQIAPRRIPFSFRVLFPGYSDRLAYDIGLIDTDLPFDSIRGRFQINRQAELYADAPDFSVRIRQPPRIPRSPASLDAAGVTALLDVMDAIAALHPGFEERAPAIASLPEVEREAQLAEVRRRNQTSARLQDLIAKLLATETYQIYFRRFSNVTPDLVRDLLVDLPYRKRPAPGGIADLYYDLLRERRAVRSSLDRFLAAVAMERVTETALRWVPDGDYEIPTVFLIYDSNAGSFAAEGKPFFNLYSGGHLAALARETSSDEPVRKAEAIMSHELHHVLVEPILHDPVTHSSWQREWIARMTRGLVGEGLANHCNPPDGFKKELYEDERVVTALVRRLNELLISLSDGTMTEEAMRSWYRDNYQEFAFGLLRQHLAARYSGDELTMKLRVHASLRPDVEHGLGWWMVSRISGEGARRDAALALLSDPYGVYARYNATVPSDRPDLKIAPAILSHLEALRSGSEQP